MQGRGDRLCTKKRRALAACERCQHRKKRCDGLHPKCSSCNQAGVECRYNGVVIEQIASNKEHLDKIEMLEKRIASLKERSDYLASQLAAERAKEKYGGDELFRSLSNLLRQSCHEDDFVPMSVITAKAQTVRKILTNTGETGTTINASSLIQATPIVIESVDYSRSTDFLHSFVQHYLDSVGKRYCFVEKSFIQNMSEKESEMRTRWEEFLMCIILAIGCKIAELARLTHQSLSRFHFKESLKALSAVDRISSRDQIRAIMLIALFLHCSHGVSDGFMMNVWELSGLAVRKSVQLGLHRKQLLSSVDAIRIELDKRLFWSVYAFDRFQCLSLGRPHSLSDDDIDVPYPLSLENPHQDLDYLYELQLQQDRGTAMTLPVTTMAYLTEICKIRSIEGTIIASSYQERKAQIYEIYEELSDRLDRWMSSIQLKRGFDEALFNESAYDYLVLSYYRAKLSLLSPLLSTRTTINNRSKTIILHEAYASAGGICRCFKTLHKDALFGCSTFSLHSVFLAGVILVYCAWKIGDISSFKIHNDIRACSNLLYSFSEKNQEADTYRHLFEHIIEDVLYKADSNMEVSADRNINFYSEEIQNTQMSRNKPLRGIDELPVDDRLLNITFEDFLNSLKN